MHKALNEVLVTLPDDTKVYVSTDFFYLTTQIDRVLQFAARPRIHKRQRRLLHRHLPERAHPEAESLRGEKPADAGQIHHW